jgi:hypothetical protein
MKKLCVLILFFDIVLMIWLFPILSNQMWVFMTVWVFCSAGTIGFSLWITDRFSLGRVLVFFVENIKVILVITTLMLDFSIIYASKVGEPPSVSFWIILISNVVTFGWLGSLLARK